MGGVTEEIEAREEPGGEFPRGRLLGWCVLVGILISLSYAAQASDGVQEDDLLYQYSTAVAAVVQYGIMLGLVLLLVRGLDVRDVLALRAPESWGRAALLLLGALGVIWAIGAVLEVFLNAGEEQGLVPDEWDPDRAGAYAANFVVVALVAPAVEELLYRGLGFTAVNAFYGAVAAIVVTSLAFGLSHGLIEALPVLSIFGAILAYLRYKTNSIYPPMILHALFNAAALIAAVTT